MMVGTCWVLSIGHSLWRAFQGNHLGWLFQTGSCPGVRRTCEVTRADWPRIALLILILLLGSAHPAEAQAVAPGWVDQPLDGSTQAVMLVAREEASQDLQCVTQGPEDEEHLSMVVQILGICCEGIAVVAAWETFKICWCRSRRNQKNNWIQTSEVGIVPMPLADGVPNRAGILFSLWKAGCTVDWEPYLRGGPRRIFPANWESFESALGGLVRLRKTNLRGMDLE